MRRPALRYTLALGLLLLPLQPRAQENGLYLTPADTPPVAEIAIGNQSPDAPVTISADTMGADETHHVVIARGHVEVMQGDTILVADQLTYYQQRDFVVAEGNISMLQPNGDVYFADKAELKDGMKRAIIEDFKARFSDSSVLVAHKAVKVNAAVTKLKSASYTPCKLCEGLSPFWQMNAGEVTVDDLDERITYHNAFLEFSGVPVFYTPYLSHPTPDASGKSGFDLPTYQTDPYFGSVVKVPYYWRIGEDKDVLLTPWVSTSEGALLQWDYRQLRDAGDYHIQGSITNPQARDDVGNRIGGHELRGHIFAQGDEEIADFTHVGFDLQRASDDTYLRRYVLGGQQALFSRAYYERAQGRNFALAEAVSIQGLRSTDNGKTTPLVLPILQGYYETPPADNGLRFHVAADVQALTRELGADQRRFSITPGASLPMVTEGGQLLTATVNLRQDVYDVSDVTRVSGRSFDGTTARTLPQAALEWRLPLINAFTRGAWLVEPIVLGVAQANGGNPDTISNEDSRLIELSDTNLFSLDRAPGLDLYDSGSRIAYGVRSHYYDTSGISLDGLIGQNYSISSDTPYPNSSRVGESFSDYIGRVAISYRPVTLSYRFAADRKGGGLNRNEVELGFSAPWLTLSSSFRSIENNRFLNDSREGIISASLPITESWSINGGARNDFEIDRLVTTDMGILYKNECFNIGVNAVRSFSRDRDIAPVSAFTFRIGLKNLGEFGGSK
ncbi:MAG: LPS assembly protein LptD [Alphaproteobacteria bacterium]|nr:LPS assembly protein LptD [Alphaproteobacteria bacterium]